MQPLDSRCSAVSVVLLCSFLAVAAGCSSYHQIQLKKYRAPDGKVRAASSESEIPVLKVTARKADREISSGWAVGVAEYPDAARGFGGLIAHAARRAQWAEVVPPIQVEETAQEQNLEFTRQPGSEQLDRVARILGYSSYLTAHVRRWRMSYFLFFQRSCVEYSLTCHETGSEMPLWRADVEACKRYATDRELAIDVLERTFRRVKGQGESGSKEGGS
jgi:hypothetical protein